MSHSQLRYIEDMAYLSNHVCREREKILPGAADPAERLHVPLAILRVRTTPTAPWPPTEVIDGILTNRVPSTSN